MKKAFQKESLHEHFFDKSVNKNPSLIRRQRTSLGPQQSPLLRQTTANQQQNGDYRQFTSAKEYRHSKVIETQNLQFIKGYRLERNESSSLQKRRSKRFRLYNVKDDMDAFSSEGDNGDTDDGNLRRSKSVPVGENVEFQIAKNAKLRRLLKIARFYGSKENLLEDDNEDICDEGYGSKTPSAEDKEDRRKPFNLLTWSITGQGLGNRENSTLFYKQPVGKFSYTHQGNKSQLYGDSEDDKDDRESMGDMSARIRYYQQRLRETPREKGDYEKLLERTYSSQGKSNESTPSYNLDIKPVTMVLRKITIQDSKESNKSNEPKEIDGLPKTYLFRTNTSFPMERIKEKTQYSDRTQLQMGNTSPEFKFSNSSTVTSQAVAKKILRPSSKADLFKRTHLPYFDFEQTNSSMPIGDLLPAVDRSIFNKSISKSPSDPTLARSLPNTARDIGVMTRAATEIVDKPRTDEEVSYFSMDFMYPGKTQNALNNSTPQPSSTKTSETKARILPSNPQQQQAAANIGVRVTANPDKETKKRLREAFSRFYNKQNVTAKKSQEPEQLVWNS
ncbi:hypothetical protein KUTeg_017182 [Tegillarca granosa]|uniref:Uncharacterized protein n=1 Tax=Tegillarca granosa TaxID=220873 RepID=A0ABQ9EMZ6_TEGGR|nr:hypothetical protein KUTeg_017182 [Tegillarca granosa]